MLKSRRARLGQGASLLTIAAALAALPAATRAQDAFETDGEFLGTIYVTGEKVVRDITETGSSVDVTTAEQITERSPGKSDVQEMIEGTPNVVYSGSVSAPTIRGVNSEGPHTGANAFFAGTVPRATINVDGHYLNYSEFFYGATSIWDVESIEVFRGPQTTSQGANAIAGAIIVNTKDPTFYREGAYRLEYGNYNQTRASFAWSGPPFRIHARQKENRKYSCWWTHPAACRLPRPGDAAASQSQRRPCPDPCTRRCRNATIFSYLPLIERPALSRCVI